MNLVFIVVILGLVFGFHCHCNYLCALLEQCSPEIIKKVNNLSMTEVFEGQELIIPKVINHSEMNPNLPLFEDLCYYWTALGRFLGVLKITKHLVQFDVVFGLSGTFPFPSQKLIS